MRPDDPRHGTNAGFFAHRRAGQEACEPCRAAKNRALKNLRIYGQQSYTTLGEEAWKRAQMIPPGVLEEQTGISARVLRRYRNGTPEMRCSIEARTKILAAQVVTEVGITRRLQALAALGWSAGELAERTTLNKSVLIARRTNPTRRYIEPRTAFEVARLYDELCMSPAPTGRSARQARSYAARKGWVGPLAWDDIDRDPAPIATRATHRPKTDVDEAVVLRVLAGDRLPMTTAERREVVRRARSRGWSLLEIEERTGIQKPERHIEREEDAA